MNDCVRRVLPMVFVFANACASTHAPALSSAPTPSAGGWAARRGWTGHWTGTWHTVDSGVAMSGTAEIDLLDRGELRGALHAVGYEGRLAGQVRPSGRAHGAVFVAEQQLTLMLDGNCAFDAADRATGTFDVYLRRLDVGSVRVDLVQPVRR